MIRRILNAMEFDNMLDIITLQFSLYRLRKFSMWDLTKIKQNIV